MPPDRLANRLVRPAAAREIPEIEAVTVAAYAEFRDRIPAAIFDAYMGDMRRLADRWEEAEVLVAELNGRVAGTVTFYADASSEGLGLPKGWAGFRRLAVHPAMRGHGIGRLLTEKCLDTARRLAAPTVGVHTAAFMQAARSIYDQMGFRRCPEYDLRASEILGLEAGVAEVAVIAYRLDLATR
jgi:GNAT superfamily N-acetyltransferase